MIDPRTGITKIELVRYYGLVGEMMMPHLKGRPVSLVRAPNGVNGQWFFQKHAEAGNLPGIRQLDTDLSSFSEESLQSAAEDAKTATDQLVEDLKGLGAPDTESGQEVKDSIDELTSALETEIEAIQTTVDETSGITELPGAVQDVLASLGAMSDAFSSALTTIGTQTCRTSSRTHSNRRRSATTSQAELAEPGT